MSVRNKLAYFLGSFFLPIGAGCIPPVYIYDQPTVLEREASGTYPLLKKQMLSKSEAMGPLMLKPNEVKAFEKEKGKIFRIVNGEFVDGTAEKERKER